ncbi:MAG TPA: hypothetical protein VGR14_01885 [Verrucomicrobiae bacterium]|jgi:hypothetical protein|nr:hypothetical protein [Verrucomicrobiae bacterium]
MKRQLTPKEKRTIRIAAVGVAIYLVLFFGSSLWSFFTDRREAYDNLVQQATDLRNVIKPYEEKTGTASNLMDRFHMDPVQLKRASVLAEASAAIQHAAAAGRVGLGPIRETPGRPSAREAGSIQFEGNGQIAAVMGLLHNLDHIGFPVIIDNLELTSNPQMPNGMKVKMTIVVLDFDAWKAKEQPHV